MNYKFDVVWWNLMLFDEIELWIIKLMLFDEIELWIIKLMSFNEIELWIIKLMSFNEIWCRLMKSNYESWNRIMNYKFDVVWWNLMLFDEI